MNREESVPFLSTARAGQVGILKLCECATETLWIWNLSGQEEGSEQIPREKKSEASPDPLCPVSSSTPRD